MKATQKRRTSPPSYEAVLLQKNSEGVYEFLEKLGPKLPPITARRSEMGVEKQLAALFATGTNSTLEWARRNPIAVTDRVRHFLFYCVAHDSDLHHLLPLSQSDREFFHLLATTYEWSWLHQIVYGWDKTPYEVQAWACEVFCLFIENPVRRLGLPSSFFLTHLRVFKNVHELPQGSSLFREFMQRSRGRWKPNAKCLSRHVCRENRWRYAMNDQPEWIEFKRINCNRHSNFAPLRRREDGDGSRGVDENAQFPNLLEIRQELECDPWA